MAKSRRYGFYVRDIDTAEVVYNLNGFNSRQSAIAEISDNEVPIGEVIVYSYSDPEDPSVEDIVEVLIKESNSEIY